MPRVLIAFIAPVFFEQLRKAFEDERDFEVFGDAKNGSRSNHEVHETLIRISSFWKVELPRGTF